MDAEVRVDSYRRRFWAKIRQDYSPWARDNIGWAIAGVVVPLILIYLRDRRHGFDWGTLWVGIALYAVAIVVWLIFASIGTAVKLDRELREMSQEAKKKLQLIEDAKPRIMLCDPDAIHTQFISFAAPGMAPCFAATFVKVRFVNVPLKPYTDKSVAKGISAKLRFFDSSSKCILPMDGRWDDTDQPSNRPPAQSKSDLLSVDFPVEGKHNVDVAFWDTAARIFVAFNNDSYGLWDFKKPGYELGGGPIQAEIRLVGAWVDETFTVNFWMGDDGKVHVA